MPEEVRIELPAEFFELHIFGKTADYKAGVVHQHIDASMIADNFIHRSGNRCELGNIEPADLNSAFDLGRYSLIKPGASRQVPHSGNHVVPCLCHLDRGAQSNA